MKVTFTKFDQIENFKNKAKHPGIYVCTLQPYIGYIGISENVAGRWFTAQSNHNMHPHNKWRPKSLVGFSQDEHSFQRNVSGVNRKMNLYAACGPNSIKAKTKQGRGIISLDEDVLRKGIESLLIYKQSQVNSEIATNRNLKWGARSNTRLTQNRMLLNQHSVYTSNPRPMDGGEIKPRKWMKRNFGHDCIDIEGLPRGRINEMKIRNVSDAVDSYWAGKLIR
tara:strand:+ start:79 stop:747 length:669 start_codon:yes stop_codon:yes gene_type:complete